MSRKPWRALRALRVLVACLVLWLPARAANTSFGAADAIVMIAGGAAITGGAEASRGAAARGSAQGARDDGEAKRSSRAFFPAATTDVVFVAEKAGHADRVATANRSVVERLYLQHCVLLR